MKNKILIVGGTGYLGSHLYARLIMSGAEVLFTGTKSVPNSKHLWIDFEKKESYKNLIGLNFDLVIILSSKLSSLGSIALDHSDLRVNTIHYADFLEFIAKEKITKQIIYASSMTVYGSKNDLPVKEDGHIEPFSIYGLSKSIAEQLTSFFCQNNAIPGVILRIPGIYGGDRESGFLFTTRKKLMNDEIVYLKTKGLSYWEAIHIEDLCDIINNFILRYKWNHPFEIFNVGYGQEIDFYTIAYYIQKAIKRGKVVVEEKEKGYVPFYLSNEKLKQHLELESNFYEKLDEYLNEIKK